MNDRTLLHNYLERTIDVVPASVADIMTYCRDKHPQTMFTKPVMAKTLSMFEDNVHAVHWSSGIYTNLCLRYGTDNITEMLDAYYRVSATMLETNNNMVLSEEQRALQHHSYEDILSNVNSNVCLKAIYVMKCLGVI